MIFQREQIERILRQISKNMLLYISANLGEGVLTESDYGILHMFGITKEQLDTDYPPFYKMFLLGRLTQLLGEKNASDVSYSDFEQFLIRKQYEPLTPFEELQYSLAKQATYHHLKNLENRAIMDAEDGLVRMMSRTEYENVIKQEIETGVSKRKSIQGVISDIGHKTKDWTKDLGRIVDTEMNNIFQQGRALQIAKQYPGQDPLVYKDVYEGACRHCIQLYTTQGLGSAPIIFKLSQLAANGSNIGRKVEDWKATISGIHPWCRCTLRYLDAYKIWDREKKEFVYDKETLQRMNDALGIKAKIRIYVGDKEYVV